MITFKYDDPKLAPIYMTTGSAGADIRSSQDLTIEPGQVVAVPTGVWIDSFDEALLSPEEAIEIQIRARSGLAYKNSICLANGVGTVDIDYPDEIKVLLINLSDKVFKVEKHMRVAQIVLNKVVRIPQYINDEVRVGGFGSTSLQ